jgi:hypothetical protein
LAYATQSSTSSGSGSMLGLHVINTDYDFDVYQEMKKYHLKPEEEKSLDEKISQGWNKFIKNVKKIID